MPMSQLDQSQALVDLNFYVFGEASSGLHANVQKFKPSVSGQLHSIEVCLDKAGSPGGAVQLKIYSNNSEALGTLLGTANNTIAGSSITEGGSTYFTFNFTNGPTLSADTEYFFQLTSTVVLDTNNDAYYTKCAGSAYHDPAVDQYTRGAAYYEYDGTLYFNGDNETEFFDLYFKQYYAESSASASISPSPSSSVSLSPSSSAGSSPSSSQSPSSSISLSPSSSFSASISLSSSLSVSLTPSETPSSSISPSPSPAFTCDLTQLADETLNTYGIGSNTTVDAAYAQSFKPTSEYPIGKVQVSVERSGNMTGSLRLLIMTSAAGVPDDIIDTSNNTYSIADLEAGVASHLDFHFDHNVFLDPDNTYFIILDAVDAVVIGLAGNIWIRGSDVFSQASDAYPDGKLMFAYGYDGISDDWSDAAFGGEGILEWMDMYFKICYDPLAWSHSPSLSPSPSVSASISPSLTPSSSVSASVSPSLSLSPSPSRSQYEDSYSIKSTIWSDKYKKW